MSPQRAQTNQYIQLYQQQKIDFENNQVSLNYKLKLPKSRRAIFLPVALKDPPNKLDQNTIYEMKFVVFL